MMQRAIIWAVRYFFGSVSKGFGTILLGATGGAAAVWILPWIATAGVSAADTVFLWLMNLSIPGTNVTPGGIVDTAVDVMEPWVAFLNKFIDVTLAWKLIQFAFTLKLVMMAFSGGASILRAVITSYFQSKLTHRALVRAKHNGV